jgi:hypothetical protein
MTADQTGSVTIGLAATFSCTPAARWLDRWLRHAGAAGFVVRQAAYGSLLHELSAPSAFQHASACVGLLCFADWQRARQPADAFDTTQFDADFALFCDCVRTAVARRPSSATASHAYAAAADQLQALAVELPRLAVLTPSQLAQWYPVAAPHDLVSDAIGHLPYTEEFFCAVGGASARALLPSLAPATGALLKAVAVDCDYTLWHVRTLSAHARLTPHRSDAVCVWLVRTRVLMRWAGRRW